MRSIGDNDRIGVLDGVRVLAVGIVAWFHFWQQTWFAPKIGCVNIEFIPRYGYLMVDMMILLSAFCLFLPYAKEKVYGSGPVKIGAKNFYIKRFARIAPVYYLVIFIILFAINIPTNIYGDNSIWGDLGPHLLFVHNWFSSSVIHTHLDGALWTVGVLVQLYLFFPLFTKFFLKKPLLTYIVMVSVSLISSWMIASNEVLTADHMMMNMYVNNTISFIGVYANGMLGAWGYMQIKKNFEDAARNNMEESQDGSKPDGMKIIGLLAAVLSIGCMLLYKVMCEHHAKATNDGNGQIWQLNNRYLLSLLFLMFILCLIFSSRYFQKIFDNRVMHFLAGISFNFYVVHQFLTEILRKWDIPAIDGENPGAASLGWRWGYLILVVSLSFVFAILLTYLVEKPCAKFIRKHFLKNKTKEEST